MRAPLVLLLVSLPGVALADDVASTRVLRARFRTDAPGDALTRVSCSLDAHVEMDGKSRPLDVRVVRGGQVTRCPVGGEAGVALAVLPDDATHDVAVEIELPEAASPESAREAENVVHAVAAEIERRAKLVPPPEPPPKTAAFAPGLTIAGVSIAAAGLLTFAAGYVLLLVDAGHVSSINPPDVTAPIALMVGGLAGLPIGALFAVIGEHRVRVETARLAPYLAPRVGGATAGFALTF